MYYLENADREREEAYVARVSSSTRSPSQSHSPGCVDGWVGGDKLDSLVPCQCRAALRARLASQRRRRRRTPVR